MEPWERAGWAWGWEAEVWDSLGDLDDIPRGASGVTE
jgi:hypothetical protein